MCIFRSLSKAQPLFRTMSKTIEQKTMAERLSDTLMILRKILDIGVEKDSSEYMTTKQHLDAWIKSGEPGVYTIPFPSHGRIAHMTLSNDAGKEPIYVLKTRSSLAGM
jgi:hypothetical protein